MKSNRGWLNTFIIILLIANTVAITGIWIRIETITDQLSSRISIIEAAQDSNPSLGHSNEYLDYYRDINAKMDQSIDRIIEIVGIATAVVSLFGILLAFRAPNDIERELEKLHGETGSASESANEARYQALISMAENESQTHERISEYDRIIAEFPGKSSAYMARGIAYGRMGEYDRAIADFENALKRGASRDAYLNNVALVHADAGHLEMAEGFYSEAITLSPNSSRLYCNRARVRSRRERFEDAMSDYEVAISLDPKNPRFLVSRYYSYRAWARKESDEQKSKTLIQQGIFDLRQARELDPSDERISELLEDALDELPEYEQSEESIIKTLTTISGLEETLGDEAMESGADLETVFAHYTRAVEAISAALIGTHGGSMGGSEIHIALKSTNSFKKVINLIVGRHSPTKVTGFQRARITSDCLVMEAMERYFSGNLLDAERLFSFLTRSDAAIRDDAANNLAYMRRRGETTETKDEAITILDRYSLSRSGPWYVNRALCYADGVGVNKDLGEFISILRDIDEEQAKESYAWWSNSQVVGVAESNLVVLGLQLVGFEFVGDLSCEERLIIARQCGYDFSAYGFDYSSGESETEELSTGMTPDE